jgi:hypothetical protein
VIITRFQQGKHTKLFQTPAKEASLTNEVHNDRPYEILRNFVESPQLPTGYIGMFALAFTPRAFFWIMNPLLEAHRLEFNQDREPTEEELVLARNLKLTSRKRIWIFTLSSFSVSTAGFLLAMWK